MTIEKYNKATKYDDYITYLNNSIKEIDKVRDKLKNCKYYITDLDFEIFYRKKENPGYNYNSFKLIDLPKLPEEDELNLNTFKEIMNEINFFCPSGITYRYLTLLQNVLEKKIEYYQNKLNNL